MHASPRRTLALISALAFAGTPVIGQERAADLTTIFELGSLVSDLNGDSVPDFVNASLVLGRSATTSETAAAAEIWARLGFETMALDLPVARGIGNGIPIVIGRAAWPRRAWPRPASIRPHSPPAWARSGFGKCTGAVGSS